MSTSGSGSSFKKGQSVKYKFRYVYAITTQNKKIHVASKTGKAEYRCNPALLSAFRRDCVYTGNQSMSAAIQLLFNI